MNLLILTIIALLNITLCFANINNDYMIADNQSSIFSIGENGYLSMVYIGNENWGLYLELKNSPSFAPSDLEIMCQQIIQFEEI